MHIPPSLRSKVIEWLLWRLPLKKRLLEIDGLRERVLKSRPVDPRPPSSFFRQFKVVESCYSGRRVFTLEARKQAAEAQILYLHGGAYVYEIAKPQWDLIGKLLDQANVSVTVPLYPLAPEHTCTQVLSFVLELYETLQVSAGGAPITLLGDSAGGGLALSLSQLLRDSGREQPSRLVLISPWLDVTCSDPAQLKLDELDPILALPGLREEGRWYAGDLSLTDPRVSPLYGTFSDLPPTLLLTGTHDLLNRDARRLRERMAITNSTLIMSEYPSMLHVWPAMPIPEARAAIAEIVSFLGLSKT